MKDCVLIGMALGFIAGALVVSNNSDAQKMVEKGKKAVKEQVKKITNWYKILSVIICQKIFLLVKLSLQN